MGLGSVFALRHTVVGGRHVGPSAKLGTITMIVLALVETAVLVTVGSREQRFTLEVGIARTWRDCNEPLVLTVARVQCQRADGKNLRVERSRWSVAEHGPFRQHNDHSCLRILQLTMRARRANVTWCALTWRRRLCRQLRGSKQPDLLPPHTFVIPLVRRFFVRFFGGLIHCVVRRSWLRQTVPDT